MDAVQATEVRRVPSSTDILKPGDYCFIPKREPIRTYETVMAELPQSWWAQLWWAFSGVKTTTKVTECPQWPDYDAVIMACPHCGQTVGTTKEIHIESVEPLTLDKPIACAYSRRGFSTAPTVAFTVKDGNIMPA